MEKNFNADDNLLVRKNGDKFQILIVLGIKNGDEVIAFTIENQLCSLEANLVGFCKGHGTFEYTDKTTNNILTPLYECLKITKGKMFSIDELKVLQENMNKKNTDKNTF